MGWLALDELDEEQAPFLSGSSKVVCPTEDAVVAALSFLPARPKLGAFVGVAVGVALVPSPVPVTLAP